MKPEAVYLSSCLANTRPGCPYAAGEDLAKKSENETCLTAIRGAHEYH